MKVTLKVFIFIANCLLPIFNGILLSNTSHITPFVQRGEVQ